MKPEKRWLVVISVGALSFSACSKNLSRGEAQRALDAKYQTERQYAYIQTGHADFSGPTNYVRVPSGQWRADAERAALADAGFIKVDVVASAVPMTSFFYQGSVDHIVLTPTDKATPLLAGTFPPGGNGVCNDGCFRFVTATPKVSIVGVGEPADMLGRKVSIVTVEVLWINTPVGDLLGKQYVAHRREAAFIKMDNGWQLEGASTAETGRAAGSTLAGPPSTATESGISATTPPAAPGSESLVLPVGQNLRGYPERIAKNEVHIWPDGRYTVDFRPIRASEMKAALKGMLGSERCDRVLLVRAHSSLPFQAIRDFARVVESEVDILALEAAQTPGTASTNPTDQLGESATATKRAIPMHLRGPGQSAAHANTESSPIVLEVKDDGSFAINSELVSAQQLPHRLHEIFQPRPDRVLFIDAQAASYQQVVFAMDVARGGGVAVLRMSPRLTVPSTLPDIDLTRKIATEADFSRCP